MTPQELMEWLQGLVSEFEGWQGENGEGVMTEDFITSLAEIMPFMALYQQMQGTEYQGDYLNYQQDYLQFLQDQAKLSQAQLAQAQQELEFQTGPYWDWYTQEYFPQQQALERLGFDTQKQLSADQVLMSGNQLGISNNQLAMSEKELERMGINLDIASQNYLQERQRSQQARLATEAAYAQMFAGNPRAQSYRTSDGRNVPGGALAYTLGYT